AYFGGTPEQVLFDNAKSVVVAFPVANALLNLMRRHIASTT
ncbi:IS21 family transposase, partial [Ralstonia solanacearum]